MTGRGNGQVNCRVPPLRKPSVYCDVRIARTYCGDDAAGRIVFQKRTAMLMTFRPAIRYWCGGIVEVLLWQGTTKARNLRPLRSGTGITPDRAPVTNGDAGSATASRRRSGSPVDFHCLDDFRLFKLVQKTFNRFGGRQNLHGLPAVRLSALAPAHIAHPLINTVLAGPVAERHPK